MFTYVSGGGVFRNKVFFAALFRGTNVGTF